MTSRVRFNPYPGLRPFRESESHLFFGRGAQVDELVAELESSRFVAVMGASGSGKSSLVAAGLLPALHGGFSRQVGSHWRIATVRPGANPTRNLARALALPGVLVDDDDDADPAAAPALEATLMASGLGLADAARRDPHLADGRLLVVVDQFEELFRFHPADAAPFVRLLIEAARDDDAPVSVIVTMRSDYLGECAQFRDLPDAINAGIYLVPRLTRTQLREAIAAPAAVGGETLAPRLVQRVLNDAGADPDVLPVVQHAMMRTWDTWSRAAEADGPIDVEHYEACGGLESALSRHAEEAYSGLGGDRCRAIAESIFKRITELGDDHRELRRPTAVPELAAVARATEAEVEDCVARFAAPGTSFLVCDSDGLVDVSHESLIRQWPRLSAWVVEEAHSRDVYRRLADGARRWERGEAALLHDPDLQLATRWWTEIQPNQVWADRYDPAFEPAARYLDRSRRAARRRRVAAVGGVALLAFLTAVAVLFAVREAHQRTLAVRATTEAQRQRRDATARQLASTSTALGARSRSASLLTALEALRATTGDGVVIPNAEQALREALHDPLGTPLGAVQPDRARRVTATAFSPAAARFAVARADGTTTLWDPAEPAAAPLVLDDSGGVNAIAFSPDGALLATGGEDRIVRLWNLADPSAPPTELPGHEDAITTLSFSPDGRLLASGSRDNTALVWQVDDTSAPPHRLTRHHGFVHSLAFAPDGKRLITGSSDGNVFLWNVDDLDGEPLRLRSDGEGITSVAFSPDGRWAATGSTGASATLWDVSRNDAAVPVDLKHGGEVNSVAFSPDGRWLATGSDDKTARLWNLQAPSDVAVNPVVLPHGGAVDTVSFDASGRWLATGSGDNIGRLFDVDHPDEAPVVLSGHDGAVTTLAFQGDERLVTGSEDGTSRLWDHLDHPDTRPQTLSTPSGVATTALTFSPDGRRLATGATDRHVRLWDVAQPDAQPIELEQPTVPGFEKAAIDALAFSPDGTRLATGGGDRVVRVWTLDGSSPSASELDSLPAAVTSLAFSPDGKRLAVAQKDRIALVWDLGHPELAPRRLEHDDEVTSVAFTRDGHGLLTGSLDGRVRRWSVEDPTAAPEVWPAPGPVTSVAISPDGRRLAAGVDDGTVLVWQFADHGHQRSLALDAGGSVNGVAFAGDDGRNLLVASQSGLQSWDLDAPDPTSSAYNPVVLDTTSVTDVAAGGSAGQFASADADGRALLWLPRGALLALGCEAAGRNLTPAEWRKYLPGSPFGSTCAQWPAGS